MAPETVILDDEVASPPAPKVRSSPKNKENKDNKEKNNNKEKVEKRRREVIPSGTMGEPSAKRA